MIDATLAANSLVDALAGEIEMVIVIGGSLSLAAFCIFASIFYHIVTVRAREQTKREIAAYVAEGTIAPDDAVRILTAGQGTNAKEVVAKRAADGWISAKKADQIIQALDKSEAARA
ncbi:MAG: hypothetical protein COB69_00470 [Phycisphaera sp.]|nr:MAG: hypothetical protein COB69_00470 [Phycisphaera sp.]